MERKSRFLVLATLIASLALRHSSAADPWSKVPVTQDDQRASGCIFLGIIPGSAGNWSGGIIYPLVKRAGYEMGGDLVIEMGQGNLASTVGGDSAFRCTPWKVKVVRKADDLLGCTNLADFKGDHDFTALTMRKSVEETVLKFGGNVALIPSFGEFHVLKCEKLTSDLLPTGFVFTDKLVDVEGCLYRGIGTPDTAEKLGANVSWQAPGFTKKYGGGVLFSCEVLPNKAPVEAK